LIQTRAPPKNGTTGRQSSILINCHILVIPNFVYSAIDAFPEINMAQQRATDKSLQKGI
jgi:hypothetical protein